MLSAKIQTRPHFTPGEIGVSNQFTLNNNHVPEINIISVEGNSGEIKLSYELIDIDNDPCEIMISYFIADKTNWEYAMTNNVSGDTENVMPGVHEIVWNSEADITSNEYDVKFSIVPNDGVNDLRYQWECQSEPFNVFNNDSPMISLDSITGNSNDITITCTLDDEENDQCQIEMLYSVDGGINYDGIINFNGLLSGTHTLTWQSYQNIKEDIEDVRIILRSYDNWGGEPGVSETSEVFFIHNNHLPVAEITGVNTDWNNFISQYGISGNIGDVALVYNLSDSDNHFMERKFYYSIDGGLNYKEITAATGYFGNNLTGTGKRIIWKSSGDIYSDENNVKLAVVPMDEFGSGATVESEVFALTNNNLPNIQNVLLTNNSGVISITYNLFEVNNEPCTVEVQFSVDNHQTYTSPVKFVAVVYVL